MLWFVSEEDLKHVGIRPHLSKEMNQTGKTAYCANSRHSEIGPVNLYPKGLNLNSILMILDGVHTLRDSRTHY